MSKRTQLAAMVRLLNSATSFRVPLTITMNLDGYGKAVLEVGTYDGSSCTLTVSQIKEKVRSAFELGMPCKLIISVNGGFGYKFWAGKNSAVKLLGHPELLSEVLEIEK